MMRRYRHFCLVIFSSFLIYGCASTPKQAPSANQTVYQQHIARISAIETFDLSGKLGVIYQDKGFSGGIHWTHETQHDNIDVLSPLGSKVAVIEKKPDIVTLTDSKNQVKIAPDVETLTATYLGWQLPLSGLSDWVLGRPNPQATIDTITWDAQGHVQTLSQQGWAIEYLTYETANDIALPKKIRIRNERVRLKLIIKDWQSVNTHQTN